ncbi:MAG: hypothetical protein WBD12_07965, partial [Candidatus Omnitrophota bacterium]
FLDQFTADEIRRADVNRDGVIDFNDYDRLSELYSILYEGVDRDIDSSGGVPDSVDLEHLRKIAVIMTESDVNGDGKRDEEDQNIILAAMGSTDKDYTVPDVAEGFTIRETGSKIAEKTYDQDDYYLVYNMTVPSAGYYTIGLTARADRPLTMPNGEPYEDKNGDGKWYPGDGNRRAPEPFTDLNGNGEYDSQPMYMIRVYVNGRDKGIFSILGSDHQYNEGEKDVFITEEEAGGQVEVKFEWVNNGYRYLDLDRDYAAFEYDSSYSTEGWGAEGAIYERIKNVVEEYYDANNNGAYDRPNAATGFRGEYFDDMNGDGKYNGPQNPVEIVVESDLDEKVGLRLETMEAFIVNDAYDERADLNRDGIIDAADLAEFNESVALFAQQARSDINGDGVVDSKDLEAFNKALEVSSTVANQVVDIDGTEYGITYDKDYDRYTIDGKVSYKQGYANEIGGRLIDVEGITYLIFDDINGEIRLVEKMVSDITGDTDNLEPNGIIDMHDWALMADSLVVESEIVSPLAFVAQQEELATFPDPASPAAASALKEHTTSKWVTEGTIVKSLNYRLTEDLQEPPDLHKNIQTQAGITYRFDIENEYEEGYDFGIVFKTEGDFSDDGYKYEFDLYLDGMETK